MPFHPQHIVHGPFTSTSQFPEHMRGLSLESMWPVDKSFTRAEHDPRYPAVPFLVVETRDGPVSTFEMMTERREHGDRRRHFLRRKVDLDKVQAKLQEDDDADLERLRKDKSDLWALGFIAFALGMTTAGLMCWLIQ